MMRLLRVLVLCVLCLTCSAAGWAAAKRVLVVTHTAGFRHSSIPTAEQVIGDLAKKTGFFTVDYCRNEAEVKQMMTAENLRKYDGVFFANTTGNLQIPDYHAFLQWIRDGHAFAGAHSAADTYHPSQINGDRGFVTMLGGEFATHGAQCEVAAYVEDPTHPAVKHLAPVYKVFDEIYLFTENNRNNVHVLLALREHPNDGKPEAGKPGDYLIAWNKRYGKGKVFYTALGHREDVWESEPFKQHILGGLKWALGLAPGVAIPGAYQYLQPAVKKPQ